MPESNARSLNIDLLKGVAIIAVVLFHADGARCPSGYLGVDVFLVLGGYFMARSVWDPKAGMFSPVSFLWRRIVRLCPLVFLVSALCLAAGYFTMLPDDLENLGETAVATNLFANNILACITTKNYWDVVNEYKPLMHTWYLGVLFQAYVLFAVLFWGMIKCFGARSKRTAGCIIGMFALSFALWCAPGFPAEQKFYYLPFRSFEFLAGVLVFLGEERLGAWKPVGSGWRKAFHGAAWAALLALLFLPWTGIPGSAKLIATVVLTALLLRLWRDPRAELRKNALTSGIAALGAASFSIYLWHQAELAFGRYCFFETWSPAAVLTFVAVLAVLTGLSYCFVERKASWVFGSRKRQAAAFLGLALAFAVVSGTGFRFYWIAGIVRDVPELNVSVRNRVRGLHAAYNSRVRDWDREFTAKERIKVVAAGDSFARDWANVLAESEFADRFEISYIYPHNRKYIQTRAHRFLEADHIFVVDNLNWRNLFPAGVDPKKVHHIGVKSYGRSNGFVYAKRFRVDYFSQRVRPLPEVVKRNRMLAERYGDHYIDFLSCIMDKQGTLPAFTPDRKFLSQDCRHLTQSGAKFYATILDIGRFAR